MAEEGTRTEGSELSQEQQKKIKSKLTMLTVGVIVLLAILLIVLVATKKMNTIWFPIGAGVILGLYWVVVDILPVSWLRLFEEKTWEQKRSYCIYALIDAVGLGGLLYFIMSLKSMTGALIYVASVLFKKRFHDEFLGVSESDDEPNEVMEDLQGNKSEAGSNETAPVLQDTAEADGAETEEGTEAENAVETEKAVAAEEETESEEVEPEDTQSESTEEAEDRQ